MECSNFKDIEEMFRDRIRGRHRQRKRHKKSETPIQRHRGTKSTGIETEKDNLREGPGSSRDVITCGRSGPANRQKGAQLPLWEGDWGGKRNQQYCLELGTLEEGEEMGH